ncbi:expressed unknown protein [Seminavis robusta]|uniref:Uncharacterized protein n=1 Tax=Seminavis robusta TaxID=568900 RepID=A0A9N8DT61_9STRA|nr:expressed unknown protein [Seminavis robusta]|eukprot:Sro352_g124320.1 n/a (695) ;mRNA; r:59191-61275
MSVHADCVASAEDRRRQLEFSQQIRSFTSSHWSNGVRSVGTDQKYALRKVSAAEVETLETFCGCSCKDWSNCWLLLSPANQASVDQSQTLKSLVSKTHLDGTNVLIIEANPPAAKDDTAISSLEPWTKCPMGIHSNLLISNSIVATNSWVTGNTAICDTHIHPQAVIMGCGAITANPKLSSQLALSVGPESGGARNLIVQPESDMIQVCQQLTKRNLSSNNINNTLPETIPINVISRHCIVRDTPTIQGIYMAPSSSIHSATNVKDVVMLPTSTIQHSSTVHNARLQWKASISSHSDVSDTLLMEEAHIGPNSLVASSILGPDVHVSAGECHCSILGPNTNAHHQSLIISVLWPLGRGNVGYGANIGSNHTGRIPDQEVASGEGVFWGLSTVIKYPVDLSMAPYSIVAAGTTLPPQRVCMPFSLIVTGNDNVHNSIIPGWVLSSSPYTIARSEKKYATRRKAIRHKHYTGWKIIRPETVNMCHWARKQLLEAAAGPTTFVTDRAIPGIGNNILSEKGRQTGIKVYTECIQRFALEGILFWMMQQDGGTITEQELKHEFSSVAAGHTVESVDALYKQVTWPLLPWETKTPSELWSYQKSLLLDEFPPMDSDNIFAWIARLLTKMADLEKVHAASILKSKKRDDQRGAKTVPGYAGCHTAAEDDPVIKEANQRANEIQVQVERIMGSFKKHQRSKL